MPRNCRPRDGDTSFANMYLAYESLSSDIKRCIEGKYAAHSYQNSYDRFLDQGSVFRPPLTDAQKAEVKEVIHPVIRIHPETGRKALFVNESFTSRIPDLPKAESDELLGALFKHSSESRFIYRIAGRPPISSFGTIAARCIWPMAARRICAGICIGTTVKGDVPL